MNTIKNSEQCSGENNNWIPDEKYHPDVLSDSEEGTAFYQDDESKIKPEVELKEETEDFVYKSDYHGHLQLISLEQNGRNQCNVPAEAIHTATYEHEAFGSKSFSSGSSVVPVNQNRTLGVHRQWDQSIFTLSKETQYSVLNWEGTEHSSLSNYKHIRACSDDSVEDGYSIKEEPTENNSQEISYQHTLPEIYDYSSDNTWEQQFPNSVQDLDKVLNNPLSCGKNSVLLTQAEKKRLYRMRIKEENPAMWSSIKKREAARKREQREKRRQILFEMQKAIDYATVPDSTPEIAEQKLYFEALKDRYPELWNQLVNALPETHMRNEKMYSERNTRGRKHSSKPARMYKDVIEAQKKRLYRQRIKKERPEMYERQKARDAYARSIQRLVSKQKTSIENGFQQEELGKRLTTLQIEHIQPMNFDRVHVPSRVENHSMTNNSVPDDTHVHDDNLNSKSVPFKVCDNNSDSYSETGKIPRTEANILPQVINNQPDEDEAKDVTYSKSPSVPLACSTQSDILWYWNDVRNSHSVNSVELTPRVPYSSNRKVSLSVTEEERMQKILKERTRLKEKRRQYRMNMSSEKRSEFLEIERERLKAYRLKKKVASLTVMGNGFQNEIVCVDQ